MSVRELDREHILAQLWALRPQLADCFGVERIGLFGSAARDALRDDSDTDVLGERCRVDKHSAVHRR